MKKERLTVKNPDGTYRIWMDRAGTFRLEAQMNSILHMEIWSTSWGGMKIRTKKNIKNSSCPKAGARSRMAYLSSQDQCTTRLLKCQIGRGNSPVFLTKNQN